MALDLRQREASNPWGLVGFSPDLSPEALLAAYRVGVFPWPDTRNGPLPWFSPLERAVLDFETLHIPRSLRTARARTRWTFTIDRSFPQVIAACSAAYRPGQNGTWIFPRIRAAYEELHRRGHAHSVEAWDGETLVGGLYGVDPGGAFTGESMFHREPNASKLCLLFLIDHLQSRGLNWLDAQVVTPHMAALGAKLIPRREYFRKLEDALQRNRQLFDPVRPAP